MLRDGAPTLVLTGAGVSAESGLATFRGSGGLWEGRDPMDIATPEAFTRDPVDVWRFYAWRRRQAAAARPNPGHVALAGLEAALPQFVLATQNVDGLHQRAGSRRVVELHGSLWTLRCTRDGRSSTDTSLDFPEVPPRCSCGAMLRPGVVWFGEMLPEEAMARAERAARSARVVIVAGTSSLVFPAAGLPAIARDGGAWIVEVNPEVTPLSPSASERLVGPSGTILPLLAAALGVASGPS